MIDLLDILDILILSCLLTGVGCCLYAICLTLEILMRLRGHLKEVEER